MVTLPTRPPADDPSYRYEVYLGDAPLPGVSHPPARPVGLHPRLHLAEEPSRGRRELVPLRHAKGPRVYVHAKPYVLVPDYRLTVVPTAAEPGLGEFAGRVPAGRRAYGTGAGAAWTWGTPRPGCTPPRAS
jgi:hypothetical protein